MEKKLSQYLEMVMPHVTRFKIVIKNYKVDVIVRVAVTIGLIYFLYTKIDIPFLWERLFLIDLTLFVSALLVTFVVSLVYVLRLFLVIRPVSKVSFGELYLINRLGNLLNFFLVGNLGQELSKFVYLKDISKKKLVYLLLFDRISGFFAMGVMLLFALHLIPEIFNLAKNYQYLFVSVGLLVLLATLGYIKHKASIVSTQFIFSILLSLVYVVGLVLIAIITFRAVGVTTVDVEMLYVTPLLGMLLFLPISINGIGLREYFLLSVLAIAPEKVVLYSLLGYIIFIILSLPGLLYYFKIIRWKKDAVE